MLFLLFMYATIIWGRPKAIKVARKRSANGQNFIKLFQHVPDRGLLRFNFSLTETTAPGQTSSELNSSDESDTESGRSRNGRSKRKKVVIQQQRRPSDVFRPGRHHYGSFYLRMGAVGTSFPFHQDDEFYENWVSLQHLASAAWFTVVWNLANTSSWKETQNATMSCWLWRRPLGWLSFSSKCISSSWTMRWFGAFNRFNGSQINSIHSLIAANEGLSP